MTILAWDGKTVSADRMISVRNIRVEFPADKIHRLPRPMRRNDNENSAIYTAVTGCGNWHAFSNFVEGIQLAAAQGRSAVDYLKDVVKYSPVKLPDWGFDAFLIGMDGDRPVMVKVGVSSLVTQSAFNSFGSGARFVDQNRAAFKDSVEMVVAACAVSDGCGFTIDSYNPKTQRFTNHKTFSPAKRKALTKRLTDNFLKSIEKINQPTLEGLLHHEDKNNA